MHMKNFPGKAFRRIAFQKHHARGRFAGLRSKEIARLFQRHPKFPKRRFPGNFQKNIDGGFGQEPGHGCAPNMAVPQDPLFPHRSF